VKELFGAGQALRPVPSNVGFGGQVAVTHDHFPSLPQVQVSAP
jgi:hypothetical protein